MQIHFSFLLFFATRCIWYCFLWWNRVFVQVLWYLIIMFNPVSLLAHISLQWNFPYWWDSIFISIAKNHFICIGFLMEIRPRTYVENFLDSLSTFWMGVPILVRQNIYIALVHIEALERPLMVCDHQQIHPYTGCTFSAHPSPASNGPPNPGETRNNMSSLLAPR